MGTALKIISDLMVQLYPETSNAYEALDKYLFNLYKQIQLKDNAKIDTKEDTDIYLFLKAYQKDLFDFFEEQTIIKQHLNNY